MTGPARTGHICTNYTCKFRKWYFSWSLFTFCTETLLLSYWFMPECSMKISVTHLVCFESYGKLIKVQNLSQILCADMPSVFSQAQSHIFVKRNTFNFNVITSAEISLSQLPKFCLSHVACGQCKHISQGAYRFETRYLCAYNLYYSS